MSDSHPPEPRGLRNLRRLVTVLTATLIVGVASIVILLILRLNAVTAPDIELPENIALPAGESATAFTVGDDWIAVVTRDGAGFQRIRVLDAATGAERSVTEIATR